MAIKADAQLLTEYSATGGEEAFRQIVSRHAALVYSAALRQTGSADLACDIAQNVFSDLATKAAPLSRKLSPRSSLAGWLYRATRYESQNLLRTEIRRAAREKEAMQDASQTTEPTASEWERLRPCLDHAMAALGDADREAILLRFFQDQPLRDVAVALGISNDAAQKRISRALEKLRQILSRAGHPATASALSGVLIFHSVQPAPAGLVHAISTAATLGQSTITASALTTNTIAMTTLHKTLIGAALAVAVGFGLYQVQQNSRLQREVRTLHATEKQLFANLEEATNENRRLSKLAAQAETAAISQEAPSKELLKLRGAASLSSREVAQLKAALADRSEKLPDTVLALMSSYVSSLRSTEKEFQENDALKTVAKLSAGLSLTPAQQQQARDILASRVEARTELEIAAETGRLPFEEVRARRNKIAQEEDQAIFAILSPDQLTAWQQMQNEAEASGAIRDWATREASRMASSINLSPEQKDQAAAILNTLKPGQGGPRLALYSNASDQLASRMQVLQSLLTDKQAQSYQRMVQQDIQEHELMGKITRAMAQNE
jgi:RNA polymerase sigma factor (sigma-70 family)